MQVWNALDPSAARERHKCEQDVVGFIPVLVSLRLRAAPAGKPITHTSPTQLHTLFTPYPHLMYAVMCAVLEPEGAEGRDAR